MRLRHASQHRRLAKGIISIYLNLNAFKKLDGYLSRIFILQHKGSDHMGSMLPDLSGIEKHPDANLRIMSPAQMPPATLDLSALNGNANLSSHMLELSTLV